MAIFSQDSKYFEHKYSLEADFERDIVERSKDFFGPDSIYIDVKKKISSEALGGVIPDGFLIDFSDAETPQFYLVEVELSTHDFFRHIFPQITKFFAFYNSASKRKELTEKLYTLISEDSSLKEEITKHLSDPELYRFCHSLLEDSRNILLIIDGEKAELPEIIDTYTDTWGKMVRLITIRRFNSNSEQLFFMEPDFDSLPYVDQTKASSEVSSPAGIEINEDFHLDDVLPSVRNAYLRLKSGLQNLEPAPEFNPQKYYISLRNSRNFAFILIRKTLIDIVIMLPESVIRDSLNHHTLRPLSAAVQGFYNGECAAVRLHLEESFDEVIELVNKAARFVHRSQ